MLSRTELDLQDLAMSSVNSAATEHCCLGDLWILKLCIQVL